MDTYLQALSRNDLSQWLVHFAKPTPFNGEIIHPFEVLRKILISGRINASTIQSICRYDPVGAACFYEVPPKDWHELIKTNPNNREGYGLIVSKTVFWFKGGRPVIYTHEPDSQSWPRTEKYRLVATDLNRYPHPIDWTHEREWRVRGNLEIYDSEIDEIWWWPCVEKIKDAQFIFNEFEGIHSIYVLELQKVLKRDDILV